MHRKFGEIHSQRDRTDRQTDRQVNILTDGLANRSVPRAAYS